MDSRRKDHYIVPDALITSKLHSAEEQAYQARKKEHEHMISFERSLVEEIHVKHRGCEVSIDIRRSVE